MNACVRLGPLAAACSAFARACVCVGAHTQHITRDSGGCLCQKLFRKGFGQTCSRRSSTTLHLTRPHQTHPCLSRAGKTTQSQAQGATRPPPCHRHRHRRHARTGTGSSASWTSQGPKAAWRRSIGGYLSFHSSSTSACVAHWVSDLRQSGCKTGCSPSAAPPVNTPGSMLR